VPSRGRGSGDGAAVAGDDVAVPGDVSAEAGEGVGAEAGA